MTIRTNIVLDISKVKAAKAITHLKTTREVVDYALGRLTRTTAALSALRRMRGKVAFFRGYDYKKSR